MFLYAKIFQPCEANFRREASVDGVDRMDRVDRVDNKCENARRAQAFIIRESDVGGDSIDVVVNRTC